MVCHSQAGVYPSQAPRLGAPACAPSSLSCTGGRGPGGRSREGCSRLPADTGARSACGAGPLRTILLASATGEVYTQGGCMSCRVKGNRIRDVAGKLRKSGFGEQDG